MGGGDKLCNLGEGFLRILIGGSIFPLYYIEVEDLSLIIEDTLSYRHIVVGSSELNPHIELSTVSFLPSARF